MPPGCDRESAGLQHEMVQPREEGTVLLHPGDESVGVLLEGQLDADA